jgi:hypothetical protein
MMWNWGAGRTRAYLICSGITLAVAMGFAQGARAQTCDHATNLALLEEQVLQADRCRMEMHIWRAEKGECASYWALSKKRRAAMECLHEDNDLSDPAHVEELDRALDKYEPAMENLKVAVARMMATREALPK